MKQEYRDLLRAGKYNDEIVIACLAKCEQIISECAYQEKKWRDALYVYYKIDGVLYAGNASCECKKVRYEYMEYRKQLKNILLFNYTRNELKSKIKDVGLHDRAKADDVKRLIEIISGSKSWTTPGEC